LFSSLFVCLSVSQCVGNIAQICERNLREILRKVGNGPMNKRLNFGGDPDHRLDTGIVLRILHCWEIRKVDTGHKSAAASSQSFILICQMILHIITSDKEIMFCRCFSVSACYQLYTKSCKTDLHKIFRKG